MALTTGFSTTTRSAQLDHVAWMELVDLVLSPKDVGRRRPIPTHTSGTCMWTRSQGGSIDVRRCQRFANTVEVPGSPWSCEMAASSTI